MALNIHAKEILEDSGYRSPKFSLAVGSMALICGMGLLCVWLPALGALYVTMVGGILGSAAVYTGGHVANRVLMGRNLGLDDDGTAGDAPTGVVAGAPAAAVSVPAVTSAGSPTPAPAAPSQENLGPQIGESAPLSPGA
jgi:hypothetical protein